MRRVILLLVGLVTLAPSGASAHPDLRSSRPAPGETVIGPLADLFLAFTEWIDLRYTSVVVLSANGDTIRTEVLAEGSDGDAVRVRLARPLSSGTYRLEWRTAGADAHVVGGGFGFTVRSERTAMPGSPITVPDSTLARHHVAGDADPPDVNLRPAAVVVRAVNFALVLLLGGGVVFLFILGSLTSTARADMYERCRWIAGRVILASAIIAFVVALSRLGLQSAALHGAGQAWDLPLLSTLISRTTWGRGWTLQLVGIVTMVLGVWLGRRAQSAGRAVTASGFAAIAIGMPFGGHAAAVESFPQLALALDAAHVLAASAWIGTLTYVLAVSVPVALRRGEHQTLSAVVRRFSAVALIAAPLVVLSGGASALLHVGRLSDLWLTDYGQLLLLKVGLVALTAATGFYNWRWMQPALGESVGTRRMRRSAGVELAVALLILVVTALLVATPTPVP